MWPESHQPEPETKARRRTVTPEDRLRELHAPEGKFVVFCMERSGLYPFRAETNLNAQKAAELLVGMHHCDFYVAELKTVSSATVQTKVV